MSEPGVTRPLPLCAALKAALEGLARNEAAMMDAWWTASGDDWAVPDWLPGKFLREVAARLAREEPTE